MSAKQKTREQDKGLSKSKNELLRDIETKFKELDHERQQTELVIQSIRKKHRNRISTRLIAEKCLGISNDEWKSESSDKIIEAVMNVRQLRLDRLQLEEIENLECYTKVTHVYLQHNQLKALSNQFQFLPNLIFLAIFHNGITSVDDELSECPLLEVLDMSNNRITNINVEQLPTNILSLNVLENPVDGDCDLLSRLMNHLPKLIELNEVPISEEMRRQGKFIAPQRESNHISNDHVDTSDKALDFESFTIDHLRQSQSDIWQTLISSSISKQSTDSARVVRSPRCQSLPFLRKTEAIEDSSDEDTLNQLRLHNKQLYERMHEEQTVLQEQRRKQLEDEIERQRQQLAMKADLLKSKHAVHKNEPIDEGNEVTPEKAEVNSS